MATDCPGEMDVRTALATTQQTGAAKMNSDGKASLNDTPSGNRVRIAFFGLRNAGKSTLVNAFCGQDVAIVSDVPGTTTDR